MNKWGECCWQAAQNTGCCGAETQMMFLELTSDLEDSQSWKLKIVHFLSTTHTHTKLTSAKWKDISNLSSGDSLLAIGKTWAGRWDRKMGQSHKNLWKLLNQWPPDLNVHTLRATKNKYSQLLDSQYLALCSVQFNSSIVSDSATPWTAACQTSLSITNTWSLLKFKSVESGMPSSHLILCRPLLLLPPIPPSIRVFSNESTLHMRWPKYWSFSFSIIPSNEHPGLISFRMDWLDLLAVQGTIKSLLHTTVQKHQFFSAQLSSQSNAHIYTWLLEKP